VGTPKFQIFPFAPGIVWKLKHGKYVLPELTLASWKTALTKKQATIVLPPDAGLLEAFYSFSLLEALNQVEPQVQLSWAGPNRYHSLVQVNGLAQPINPLNQSLLRQFPTPLFLDREQQAYFNCLNNYLTVSAYYGQTGYQDKRAVVQQITEKSLLPWSPRYIPKLRTWPESKELTTWLKLHRIYPNSPFVLIIPEVTTHSQHQVESLTWGPQPIRALAAMLSQVGITTIVAAMNPAKFYDSIAVTLPFDLNSVLQLMPQAQAILAKDLDFLLLALSLSEAKLLTTKQPHQFKLEKNQKFLGGVQNQIYTFSKLEPLTVFYSIYQKTHEH
jgi:hypothetical protein